MMKEKTFEELIKDHSILLRKGDTHRVVPDDDVLKLMQQVREATKVEIMERVIELNGQMYREPITEVFNEFPTDRIRIEP